MTPASRVVVDHHASNPGFGDVRLVGHGAAPATVTGRRHPRPPWCHDRRAAGHAPYAGLSLTGADLGQHRRGSQYVACPVSNEGPSHVAGLGRRNRRRLRAQGAGRRFLLNSPALARTIWRAWRWPWGRTPWPRATAPTSTARRRSRPARSIEDARPIGPLARPSGARRPGGRALPHPPRRWSAVSARSRSVGSPSAACLGGGARFLAYTTTAAPPRGRGRGGGGRGCAGHLAGSWPPSSSCSSSSPGR